MKEYIVESGDALYDENTGKAVFNLIVNGELIRCRDCKYFMKSECVDNRGWCSFSQHGCPMPDDFCSDAERKES